MAFHNVPPNGFPDIPDIEDLEAVQGDITALKTGKTPKTDIAAEFSATTNYAVGDLVYKDGVLYECTTAHEAAAWAAGDFTAANVGAVASQLMSGLTSYEATTNAALALPTNSGKNLLNTIVDTQEINGVTFTVNRDASGHLVSIVANGTASAETRLGLNYSDITKLEKGVTYVLSGNMETQTGVTLYLGDSQARLGIDNPVDTGSGVTFTPTKTGYASPNIYITNGVAVNNKTFYPMIRPATITDSTFAPYIPSVESRIEAVENGLVKITKESFEQVTVNAGSKKFVTNIGLLTDNVVVTAYSDNSDVIAYVATATTTYQVYLYNPTNSAVTSNITVMVAKV